MNQLATELHYDKAPMRARSGDWIASEYGYDNITAFAEALPPGAQVADVGAGLSRLGSQVCELRNDVEWVNVDVQYGDFASKSDADAFERLIEHKPSNLEYEAADALALVETFGEEQFDRLFSYWMIQHIILDSPEMGAVAAENMLKTTKLSGKTAIGPVYRGASKDHHVAEVVPAADEALVRAQADQLVDSAAMGMVPAMIERFFRKRASAKRRERTPSVLQLDY